MSSPWTRARPYLKSGMGPLTPGLVNATLFLPFHLSAYGPFQLVASILLKLELLVPGHSPRANSISYGLQEDVIVCCNALTVLYVLAGNTTCALLCVRALLCTVSSA